jgi:hypothetical protein
MKRSRTPLEIGVPLRNNTKRGKLENAVQALIHEPFPLGTPLRNYLDDVKRFLSCPHPQVLDEEIAYLRLSYGFTIAALPEALQELALYRDTEHKLTPGTLAKLTKFVSCTGKVMNCWSALPTSERENYHGLPGWFTAWDRRTECSDLRGWKVERYLAADLYETVTEALSDYTPLKDEQQKQVELNVSEDWARPFLGVAAIKLRDHLLSQKAESDTLHTRNYARAFPVLQSSGTGKSRTVVQLSTLEPGFMICVRPEPRRREVTSQPPRDDHIGQWLLPAQADTPFTSHAKAAAWLAALADTMANFHKEEIARASNGPPDWKDFKVQMARFLAPGRALDCLRTDCPETISSAVNPQHETGEPSTSSPSSGSSLSKRPTRRTLLRKISEAAQKTMESAAYQPSKPGQRNVCKIAESFGLDLNAAFTRLEDQLDPFWNEDAFFHITIDECSALQDNLHVLRRLWAELESSRFWLLFVDTDLQIAETCSGLTATGTLTNLTKVLHGELRLLAYIQLHRLASVERASVFCNRFYDCRRI